MADSSKTTRSSKRKRTQVSYSADDYFDSLDMDSNGVVADVDGEQEPTLTKPYNPTDDSDDEPEDGEFTRKGKGKAPPKKKLKAAQKVKTPKTSKPFPFMELPAELRDEIYDLCLTEPGGLMLVAARKASRRTVKRGVIAVEDGNGHRGKPQRRRRYYWYGNPQARKIENRYPAPTRSLVPNLLATCKQIREEASSVLYKQEIILEDTTTMLNFIGTIGEHNRQIVSDLTLCGWDTGRGVGRGHNSAAFAMLSVCKNIQSLFLDCTIDYHRTPSRLAGTVFSAMHFFLEALGKAKGQFDAALDVLELADCNFDKVRVLGPGGRSLDKEYRPASEVETEFEESFRGLLARDPNDL